MAEGRNLLLDDARMDDGAHRAPPSMSAA